MRTFFISLSCIFFILSAQGQKSPQSLPLSDKGIEEQVVNSEHEIIIGGKKLSYTATAGTAVLKDDKDQATGAIFYIAYTKKNEPGRPVTFSFNGGPGSSSVWLHLGVLGPKRILMGEKGDLLPPPYHLTPNEYTLLESSDLVFIDPISTGYSKTADSVAADHFFGIDEDIASVGEFIRIYLSKNNRFNSSKFLIGESYGTIRASGLSSYLQDQYGIYLNGIMLVSPIINFLTARFDSGNDMAYLTSLPSYTAVAWYHKKLSRALQEKNLEELLKEVEDFAITDYALALHQGYHLSDEAFDNMARQLSAYTGLSIDYIKKMNLRVKNIDFQKQLLEKENKVTGRFDARFTRPFLAIKEGLDYYIHYEPSSTIVSGPFSSAMYDYLKTELRYDTDKRYKIEDFETVMKHKWKLGSFEGRYIYMGDHLSWSAIKNPYLKVFVASGYYDLATPYSIAKYDFNHLFPRENIEKNLTMKYYKAGHMMYIDKKELVLLSQDLKAFIRDALNN